LLDLVWLCSDATVIVVAARRLSNAALQVLAAIAAGSRYGFVVIDRTGLPSGTVYPALSRLERDGYVRSHWEDEAAAHQQGRPARRYYRVTAAGERGLIAARESLGALLRLRLAASRRGRA
jgi:DNA-binding PadR family transcriptional regulator